MSPFEAIKHEEDGVEYWSARELATVLEYARFDKFKQVIEKARVACASSGYEPSDHISHTGKMVQIGSGAVREIEDFHLSRYACHLIVQNADPEKPVVALGQTYFASQTRLQELMEDQRRIEMREAVAEHGKQLNAAASEVGVVTARDFAAFTDHGYMGLYAGERRATFTRGRVSRKGSTSSTGWGTRSWPTTCSGRCRRRDASGARARWTETTPTAYTAKWASRSGRPSQRWAARCPKTYRHQPRAYTSYGDANNDGWRPNSNQASGAKSPSPDALRAV
jgi:hypothetical protein